MASSVGAISCTRYLMPRCSASNRPREVLVEEESLSGSSRPNTFAGPNAWTDRAAQTELSIPPEMATTNPRRCRILPTTSRMREAIFSTSAGLSNSSTDALSTGLAFIKTTPDSRHFDQIADNALLSLTPFLAVPSRTRYASGSYKRQDSCDNRPVPPWRSTRHRREERLPPGSFDPESRRLLPPRQPRRPNP